MSPIPKKQSETKTVKKEIKKLFDKHGWFWWCPPANAFGRSGISDFQAVKAGMFMAVEAKLGNNPPTAMQVAFLNSIRAADHFAFVVNEKNLEWLEVFLRELDASIEAAQKGEKITPEGGAIMLNAIKALTDAIAPNSEAI